MFRGLSRWHDRPGTARMAGAGVREMHMQFQFEHEMGTIRLRLLVTDPDALFREYRERGVECTPNALRDTGASPS